MGLQGAKRFRRQSPAEFAAQLAPDPVPAPVAMNVPAIPDEILRDVQSRGTVGPGMVPTPAVKPPRQDAIKVPIKMPPVPIIPEPMPDPVQTPIPMPSLPKFPMPQIDPMGRVAAPLTRGPVNTAINRPAVGMRGPGPRIR